MSVAKENVTNANHVTIVKLFNSIILCESGAELKLNSPSVKTSNLCSKLYGISQTLEQQW